MDLATMRVPQRIVNVLMLRMQSLALVRNPTTGKGSSWRSAYRTADWAWIAIGDKASGYDHYTKRIILAIAWKPISSYWVTDSSADREQTRKLLESRLLKVGKLFGPLHRLRNWFRAGYLGNRTKPGK